jgi:hypothetical protein
MKSQKELVWNNEKVAACFITQTKDANQKEKTKDDQQEKGVMMKKRPQMEYIPDFLRWWKSSKNCWNFSQISVTHVLKRKLQMVSMQKPGTNGIQAYM